MSVCTFIASDSPLREVARQKEDPLAVNAGEGATYDGGADDSFFLHMFQDVQRYTGKKYGV